MPHSGGHAGSLQKDAGIGRHRFWNSCLFLAQGKTAIDRTIALGRPGRSLANKIGGIVVVGGSLGLVDAVKDLYFFIVTRQMLPASFVAAYAANKGDVIKLEKGMEAAQELGMQMVRLAEKKFEYPSEFKGSHFGYGTHTW
jgi:multimeric flavodoxin WrbA